MVVLEVILAMFIVVSFYVNIGFGFKLMADADKAERSIFKEYILTIKEDFSGRNFIGIIMTLILYIWTIPGFLLAILVYLLMWFCSSLAYIYSLGDKKDKEEE